MNLGRLWLTLEAWSKATEPLAASEQLFNEMSARDTQVDALLLQSELLIGQGLLSGAVTKMEQAATLLAQAGQTESDQQGRLLRQRGMAALQAGNLVEAEQTLSDSIQLFSRLGDTFEQAKSRYQMARLAHQAHDSALAQRYAHEAHATFIALGAQLEAQRCEDLTKELNSR
jgi:hypothetical protein